MLPFCAIQDGGSALNRILRASRRASSGIIGPYLPNVTLRTRPLILCSAMNDMQVLVTLKPKPFQFVIPNN